MNVKKVTLYEVECPSCLSIIQFERYEVKMGGYDEHGTIKCPVCHYEIVVTDRTSLYGCEAAFKNCVRPIYETKEGL